MTSSIDQSQTLRDLHVFHNVARALASSLELDSILRVILQQMEQFFQPETWSLLMVDERRNDLYYVVAVGHSAEELRDVRVAMGEGMAGWVAQHGETLILPEVGDDPRFSSMAEHPSGAKAGIRSAICIPLRSRLRTLGVIQIFNSRLDKLTDYTISFLLILCDFAAIAIENAHTVERVQELTITDDCTGLYNSRHLYRMLHTESERVLRTGGQVSIIFIDLDYFKRVNDEYGHLVGTQLLAEVGQAIKSLIRPTDAAFRYGGDEFVVLLPDTSKDAAAAMAQRICHSLRSTQFRVSNDLRLGVRASFGVATCPDHGASVHEIIREADRMMYQVKGTTRDNVAVAGHGVLLP